MRSTTVRPTLSNDGVMLNERPETLDSGKDFSMRWIDDIIKVVQDHPHISEVHKQILIDRIEKPPVQEEINAAAKKVFL